MSQLGHSHHFERPRSVSVCPLSLLSLPIPLTQAFAAKGQLQTSRKRPSLHHWSFLRQPLCRRRKYQFDKCELFYTAPSYRIVPSWQLATESKWTSGA
jgi:hypothetical protein